MNKMKPASGKLKKDLFERKFEITTIIREMEEMKIEYSKLNKKIKSFQEKIIELPEMQTNLKKMKSDFKKKQIRLNQLKKLELEQKQRDQEQINKKKGR